VDAHCACRHPPKGTYEELQTQREEEEVKKEFGPTLSYTAVRLTEMYAHLAMAHRPDAGLTRSRSTHLKNSAVKRTEMNLNSIVLCQSESASTYAIAIAS
jgi:hypothetical protein